MRGPIPADALTGTSRLIDIIEREDAGGRIIAALIDLVDGHAATGAAPVVQQGVHQQLDRRQIDRAGIALQERAHPARPDVAAQREGPRHALAHEAAHRHGRAAGYADDVLARAVGRVARQRGGVGPVPQELHHPLRPVVLDCGERAEAGAAAVDAQGGGEGGEEKEGGEGGGGGGDEGGQHCEGER